MTMTAITTRTTRAMVDASRIGFLHLTLHLINGRKMAFVQTDPDVAQGLLDHLRPERFFAQKQLLISGEHSVSIVSLADIERVDLCTEPLPEWPYNERIQYVEEISEEEFLRIQRRDPPPPPPVVMGRAMPQKPPSEVGMLVELRSGNVAYLSIHLKTPEGAIARRDVPTPEDTSLFFHHLFTRPVLFGTLEENRGIFLLNPANAIHFQLTPSPPEPSAGSWPMEVIR